VTLRLAEEEQVMKITLGWRRSSACRGRADPS
jgi:hypothetical protein